ncbi:MAG: hypothetical protein ACOCUI_00800 [bacterium]
MIPIELVEFKNYCLTRDDVKDVVFYYDKACPGCYNKSGWGILNMVVVIKEFNLQKQMEITTELINKFTKNNETGKYDIDMIADFYVVTESEYENTIRPYIPKQPEENIEEN